MRTTIGQELKALYEAPRDLPQEMTTFLMHLNRAETGIEDAKRMIIRIQRGDGRCVPNGMRVVPIGFSVVRLP